MSDDHPGLRITVYDLETGDHVRTITLKNDWFLVAHGTRHLAHQQEYNTTGTTVLTVKTHRPDRSDPG